MMMNETIVFRGRPVRGFALGSVGVGDVGDLLAYRQEWEPFVGAHLELWRHINELLESVPDAQKCPPGIFTAAQIPAGASPSFCASLALSRIRISNTDPGGILTQWNAWKDKSAADLVSGAPAMLAWHQEVVMRVGGDYKDELLNLAKIWKIDIQLPDLPSFSLQQEIRARIEGAYITTKGVIQIVGYGVGEALNLVSNVAEAVSKGLSETARKLPTVLSPWTFISIAAVVAVVGGALVVYYMPRRQQPSPAPAR